MTLRPFESLKVAPSDAEGRRAQGHLDQGRGVTTLDIRDLAVRRGGQAILEGVSFSAARGELLAVMGESGSGKTTVIRAIAGLDPIAAGTIDLGGVRLVPGPLPRGATRRDLHRSVGIVFQFHCLFSHMSALDNVSLAPVHVLRDQ